MLSSAKKPSVINVRSNDVSLKPSSDETLRRAVRVISMVHELHKVGYQRLRIASDRVLLAMCDSSCECRFAKWLGATRLVSKVPEKQRRTGECPICDCAGESLFGMDDASGADARKLALKFLGRFPKIANAGVGLEWRYAGWLTWILGNAEKGVLSILYANFPVAADASILPPPP